MSTSPDNRPADPYWRSLDQLADAPRFRRILESEFPVLGDGGVSRRRWLQLMGASLALAGVGGCWQREEILPFDARPEGRVPGKPQQFMTATELGSSGTGLMVRSVDGRPIKIEGNPAHPQSLGATDALAQAAILELYDPDRSRAIISTSGGGEVQRTCDDFARFVQSHFASLAESRGAGFRVLAEATSSPTLAAMRAKLLQVFSEAKWCEYEPISWDQDPYRPHFALEEADVIVALDADLFASHPAALQYARGFAAGREAQSGRMNRLYVVESCLSVTGASADHRLPLASGKIGRFAAELYRAVSSPGGKMENAASSEELPSGASRFLQALARDLVAHRQRSVVAVGPGQPAEVHAIVRRINAALGNVDKTVRYFEKPSGPTHVEGLRSLVAEMAGGEVSTLLILGGNPVYNAPVDFEFAEALGKVATTIHLSLYRNETSLACEWHVPRAHFLESWGDVRSYDGTYSVVQPLIALLYGGRTAIELLGLIVDGDLPQGEQLVRATFAGLAKGSDVDALWRRTLHDGLLPESGWDSMRPEVDDGEIRLPERPSQETGQGKLEIVFQVDRSVYDGRFANNGWLQELPDPITRLTWDNAALLSPATARRLGVEDSMVVALEYRGRSLEIPACVLPGMAAHTVAVSLGYGRSAAGHVGGRTDGLAAHRAQDRVEPVGANAYRLRTSEAMCFDSGLSIRPTERKATLAGTQDHFAIDTAGQKERGKRVDTLIKEASLEAFEKYRGLSPEEREAVDITGNHVHHPPLVSLWEEHEYSGHRWGMAIDLSKCIGCGACVVACQAENNIPVVGKSRVAAGRQMHWLRVDRYFQGDPEDPRVVMQPVACHQCEMAPCEQVCPVAATVHSEEGLNEMVYNRCIGTRYCANNCPYKVRRFNFFAYHKDLEEPAAEVAKMKYNPQVTVRSRGVMEKCTYCVQRIQAAKIETKNRREPIEDGRIQTACQQVCPTRAIEFGDLSDEQSAVYRAHAAVQSYAMLAELNVKPRTAYLARIRNPNPELMEDHHLG
jgi:molybdopterin-containing oxidoreductase family iron-sulfur binding subunit